MTGRDLLAGRSVARIASPVEATVDQGNVNVFSASVVPFEVGAISWSSPSGPLPVRLTFPVPVSKAGAAVVLPRTNVFTGGFPQAVIEYAAEGSIATRVIVDWPMNGRSVVFVASRVTVRLRTSAPGVVTAAGQALFPIQLSDAGPVTPRDFAPMTFTGDPATVPASSAVALTIPQNATAVMMSPQSPGVQMTVACVDESGNATLTRQTAAAAAGTERPEDPTPIPASAQEVSVSTTGLVAYDIRPVWLVDL